MMVLCSNHSSKAFHAFAQMHPGKVGWMLSPGAFKSPRSHLPFALDNGAFSAWKNGTAWESQKWIDFLDKVANSGQSPLWVLVPDKVADRDVTIHLWKLWSPVAAGYGWPLAFAVQDGMTPRDVPCETQVVFVGGTTHWKWRSIPMWTSHFNHVHVGRVTTGERLEIAERNGVESVDGTGFFRGSIHSRQAKQLFAFVEGHRNGTPQLQFK